MPSDKYRFLLTRKLRIIKLKSLNYAFLYLTGQLEFLTDVIYG